MHPVTRSLPRLAAAACLAFALTACGGGGDDGSVTFDIGVIVAGQPLSSGYIHSGSSQSISVWAGDSLQLDASEPVVWSLQVAGTSVSGSGTTVYYGGIGVTIDTISASRILVDTFDTSAFSTPVALTFTATSTYDAAVVATVTVYVYY